MSNLNRLRAEQKQLVAMLRGRRPSAQTSRIQARLGDVLKQIREIDEHAGMMPAQTTRQSQTEMPGEFKSVRRSVKLRDEPTPKGFERADRPYERQAGKGDAAAESRAGWLMVAGLGIGVAILFVSLLGMLRCEAATGSRACSNNSFLVGIWLADPL